ncbi:MAG TPA: VWA domain-containing protein [Pyrinomonadaceae bacterium]|nr:VWA domain-containing protein [Pyrinomonadaceae bacterium]
MRKFITLLSLVILVGLMTSLSLVAQKPRRVRPRPVTQEPTTAEPEPTPPDTPPDVETIKTDTELVTIPVIATNATGMFVPDLKREELSIFEDNAQQQVAFFGTVSTPFQVVLMLDTSASTEGKLRQIQEAALVFIEKLRPVDRVKIISFDDQVNDINEFTSDRSELRAAVLKTRSGRGTKLYDAVDVALSNLRGIQGRKAIVLFTDGMDYHSDACTFDGTLYGLDEEGVIVYPIRFETRAATEKIARAAAEETLPTTAVISTSPGTTAPTFPSDDPNAVKAPAVPRGGILGLPSPAEIMRRTRRDDPRYPDPGSDPTRDPRRDPGPTNNPLPPDDRGSKPPGTLPDPNDPRNNPPRSRRAPTHGDDSISGMLDGLYATADSYLEQLATKSGGRLLRADTLASLPDAFTKIAAELGTQYSIGYYPTNKTHDGKYRKVKLSVTRKDVSLRARPGYRAPSN